jgi:AcrR family transcriptional regulator
MPARPTARRKLLDVAAALFYREGVGAIGVDRISAEAGVSKRSLYQHFASKDALVAAALADFGPAILERYVPVDDDDAISPRQKILGAFDALGGWSRTPDFRGCPFLNVSTELADPHHPARAVARDYKLRLLRYFTHQARIGRADRPETLAEQLLMVFDGAISRAVMDCAPVPGSARAAAEILLDAHGLSAD